jgi:hypothetical protein
MKPLFYGWRLAAVCSLIVALPVGVACTAAPATGSGSQNVTGDSLDIQFPKMYSAFEPGHTYAIPAKVEGVKHLTWTADPEDAVDFSPGDDASSILITIKKAYDTDVTITATSGNLSGTAPLHITSATADNWTEGSQRYNNGVVIQRGKPDGGWATHPPDGGHFEKKIDPSLACTNCHDNGKQDVEHTPQQAGGYSDDDLVKIMTQATKPEGVPMRVVTQEQWSKFHKWSMSPDEQKGLIVYLRSKTPKSQGEVDFGDILHAHKGGPGGGGGGGGGSSAK